MAELTQSRKSVSFHGKLFVAKQSMVITNYTAVIGTLFYKGRKI